MIEIRTLRDELARFDKLHRRKFCACCADESEARASSFRRAFEKAGAKGNTGFLTCANCSVRWLPETDINYAVRDWVIVATYGCFVATLCGPWIAENPDPARLPRIARLILSRSPNGPLP